MLTRLIVTEKPSVAMRYASVLGVKGRQDGYLEGRGYLISWCFGHLWGLADAVAYDPKYKKWNQSDLPILPTTWQYQLLPGSQKQMALLRRLMDREDVTEIVNACDPGREGELIFRNVYNLAQCTKPMLRLWVSSMEDEAIREGFAHLRPGLAFNGVYEAALCRAQADWLVGINATRLFSTAYHRTLVIGRVISPTLSMVVNREQEIAGHKPETFYRVCLTCEGVVFQSEKLDQAQAEALAAQCAGQTAVVEELRETEQVRTAPALLDLTALQRLANKQLGYTAQQTLDYAQSLYEKKLLTYPRTDSRYLTEDMADGVPALAQLCAAIAEEDPARGHPWRSRSAATGKSPTTRRCCQPEAPVQPICRCCPLRSGSSCSWWRTRCCWRYLRPGYGRRRKSPSPAAALVSRLRELSPRCRAGENISRRRIRRCPS